MTKAMKPIPSQQALAAALAAGQGAAAAAGVRVSIAIVDDGGHLLAFSRMDDVHTGTVEVSIAKARTAASFRKPSRDLAESLAGGMSVLLTLPGCLPLAGGVPIVEDGCVIAAVGVSGASPQVDDRVAEAVSNAYN